MATIIRILFPFLLVGSRLPQARVALRVGLPHLHLEPMDPGAENKSKHPQATLKPLLMAIMHMLDVDLQNMASLMIVDNQGIHIKEEVEIYIEDSETRIGDSMGAVSEFPWNRKTGWPIRGLLGKRSLKCTIFCASCRIFRQKAKNNMEKKEEIVQAMPQRCKSRSLMLPLYSKLLLVTLSCFLAGVT